MRDAVTYSLFSGYPTPEEYYRRVRQFTDEVLGRASATLLPAVEEFMDYLRSYRLEGMRSREEYLLELLSFALLWNAYGGYALAVRKAPFMTLARMAEWRKRHQRAKPAIDLARGILVTLFLLPPAGVSRPKHLPTLKHVDRLCLWLEATGEFREQALRFVRWRAYWETMPPDRWIGNARGVFSFADWFAERSRTILGEFTANVEGFLNDWRDRYRWREDRVQCMRSRVEYHLNMVGAEIMNRAFRSDFAATGAKVILLPGCMRARPEGECEAIRVPEGLHCSGCEPGCRVNQLRELGRKNNIKVFIIPHASDLSRWSPQPGRVRRGVVAAACVTTLVEGGWELRRYDVPAQCVLLNSSGCRKHWHCSGVTTGLNMRELKRILSQENGGIAGSPDRCSDAHAVQTT